MHLSPLRFSAVLVTLCAAPDVFAFSYESPIAPGCHEKITTEAWRPVRDEQQLPELVPSDAERALIDDLPFHLPGDMRDLAGASLLMGVRDNDLKGRSGIDTNDLATVHGHPDGQLEHCLRRPEQDEGAGSQAALEECRAYIRNSVFHAIDEGLDADGRPDPSRRTILPVFEEIGPRANASLPVFHVYMGQALHALQDSFTHTFRSEDGKRVRVVLNWIDFANDTLDEHRDGPPHMTALDHCDDATELNRQRRVLATEASEKMFRAVLEPGDTEERKARVDAVLDEYLSYEPGCYYEDRWCDAPEQVFRDPGGCSAAGPVIVPGLFVLALWGMRRRGGGRGRGGGALRTPKALGIVAGTAIVAAALGWAPEVRAQDSSDAPAKILACVPGQQIACACSDGVAGAQRCNEAGSQFGECHCARALDTGGGIALAPDASVTSNAAASNGPNLPVGLYIGTGVSIDRTALVTTLGAWHAIDPYWSIGASAQWNPWWSIDSKRFRPGVTNVYASVVRRYPINDWATARTSAHLGVSVLLYDLYGAPASSVGAYAAFSFLGMELKLSRGWTMIIDPCEVAMPAPHLTGAPITFRQYRFAIGFQYGS